MFFKKLFVSINTQISITTIDNNFNIKNRLNKMGYNHYINY